MTSRRSHPPTFTGLIRDTLYIFRHQTPVVAVPTVTYFLVQTAMSFFSSWHWSSNTPNILGPIGVAMSKTSLPWDSQLPWIIAPALFSYWTAIVYMLWLIRAIQHRKDGIRDTPDYVEYAVKMSIPWFITSILVGLILMGGSGFLMIPTIIFGVWYWLAAPVVVYEGKWGLSAMRRSRTIIQGFWGNVFSYGLFLWAISFVWAIVLMVGMPWMTRMTRDLPFPFLITSPMTMAFSTLISVFVVTFKTVVYEALHRVHTPARKISVVPEVVGFGLTALTVIVVALIIGFAVPRIAEWAKSTIYPSPMSSQSAPFSPSPTKRTYRSVGSAPAAVIAKDAETVKNFHMVNLKIQAYFFQLKEFPDRLSDLTDNGYIVGDVPTNRDTGLPFVYTRTKRSEEVRDGYLLCPEAGATRERCYFQTEYQ